MISVEEALQRVAGRVRPPSPVDVPLANCLDHVLATDIASDIDSPPFDKSLVDGYAVRAADLTGGVCRLGVLEEVVAGTVPSKPVGAGQATRIMTGAPLPDGSDAVVMFEQTRAIAGPGLGDVEIVEVRLAAGSNVLRQGAAMRRGEIVLHAGQELRPIEVGLLAEVGRAEVPVFPHPEVAVLPTGNEIVPPSHVPRPGQIRNSNGPLLAAAVRRAGGVPIDLGVARDEAGELRRLIAEGLRSDVLLLSGGVSAGVLDLVPQALADLGVVEVFHKVQFKPGKPLWFGVLPTQPRDKLVFGLPGNPVSSLACFELFVRPALAALGGRRWQGLPRVSARLEARHIQRGDRPTYHPAACRTQDGQSYVRALPWQGSADLRGVTAANSLAYFPAGDRTYAEGETVEVLMFV